MLYSVLNVEVHPGKVNDALAGIEKSTGREALRACWYAEIGRLNRVLAIYAYPSADAAANAQAAALTAEDPFGVSSFATGVSVDTYASFPGVDVLPPGDYGPVFEVRQYQLRKTGLKPTIDLWAKAVPPRSTLSPLATVLYALSGLVPRFMHIWPYRTLNDRVRIREDSVKQGLWPPPGGLAHIESMQSEIYLPAAFSPVH